MTAPPRSHPDAPRAGAASPAGSGPRTHRWTIGRLAYPLAERTVEGWRSLSPAARRAWMGRMAIGLAGCLALSLALTWVAMRLDAGGVLAWEGDFLRRLDAGLVPMSYHSGVWLGAFGSTAMLVPLVFVAAMLFTLHGRVLTAWSVLLAYFAAKPIVLMGWWLWDRARPEFIMGGAAVPLSLNAYPSGHAVQTVSVYGLLVLLWTRESRSALERALAWLLLAAFVLVTAVGRLRIGAHWPSDVVAGVLLGAAWMLALGWALRVAARHGAR